MQEISIRNLHLRGKLELPGIAWKQGGPDRSRFAEENFFQAERQKRKFATFWPEGGKEFFFFLAQGRKRNFLSDRKAERKMCYFLAVPDRQKGKNFKGKRKLRPAGNFLSQEPYIRYETEA